MAHDLTLWGVGTSRTMRAHWMLLELDLEYETQPIQPRTGETLRDDYQRINPRHKIPALRHGDFIVTESAAIVQYLVETFGDPRKFYIPCDAKSRAALNEWCFFIMTELDAGSLYVVRRHSDLKQTYGDAPVAIESAKQYFAHNLDAMAERICIGGPYLFGDLPSAADILLMTCLDWAVYCGIVLPKPIAGYQHRMAQRSAYQAALKRNFMQISR
ncbi:MAG TPA: glutathione S-transferase family protein [Candidatus Binataceae bacterium]|nr:glutathione S-transferase family protein [Candidatus Binataceae bacterium]